MGDLVIGSLVCHSDAGPGGMAGTIVELKRKRVPMDWKGGDDGRVAVVQWSSGSVSEVPLVRLVEAATAKTSRRDELEAEYQRAGRALKALSGGGPMGLTPAAVRATPEWQAAKRAADAAFAALRAHNAKRLRGRGGA